MKKRGQSQIITTVLIILIVLASIIIVWNVFKIFIKNNIKNVDVQPFEFSANLEYSIQSPTQMNVKVKRGNDNQKIQGIKIVLEDTSGKDYIYENKTDYPKSLETRIYALNSNNLGLTDFNEITKVSVHFIYLSGDSEKVTPPLDSQTTGVSTITQSSQSCNNGDTKSCSGTNPCKNYQQTCVSNSWGSCTETGDKPDGTSCGNSKECQSGNCVNIGSSTKITDCGYTISKSGNYKISSNIISTSSGDCITINARNVILDCKNKIITGKSYYNSKGISISGQTDITIKNCRITNFYYGIYFDGANYNKIQNNEIYSNNYEGIYFSGSSNNEILNNKIYGNNRRGIYLTNSKNNKIIENEIYLNNNEGIYIRDSSDQNTIFKNNLTSNQGNSISISGTSQLNNITQNIIKNGNSIGIYINSNNCFIYENNITKHSNNEGVYIRSSQNTEIINNSITDNKKGIYISSSSNTILNKNIICNNNDYDTRCYSSSITGNENKLNTNYQNSCGGFSYSSC